MLSINGDRRAGGYPCSSVFIRGCPWPCLSVFIRGCSSVAVRPRPIISRYDRLSLISGSSARCDHRARRQPSRCKARRSSRRSSRKRSSPRAARRCSQRLDGRRGGAARRDRDRVGMRVPAEQPVLLPDRGCHAAGDPRHRRSVPRAPRCSCCRRTNRMERSEGSLLSAGPARRALTGIEHVRPRADFEAYAGADARRTDDLHDPPRRDRADGHARPRRSPARARERGSLGPAWIAREQLQGEARREGARREVREPRRHPRRAADDQSPREIALLRESSRIAGLAMMEAMRVGRAGDAVRDRGDRRLRLQEAQRAGTRVASVSSRPGRTPRGRTITPRRRRLKAGDRRALRLRARLPLLHLRRRTHVPGERHASRRSSASSTASTSSCIRRS